MVRKIACLGPMVLGARLSYTNPIPAVANVCRGSMVLGRACPQKPRRRRAAPVRWG